MHTRWPYAGRMGTGNPTVHAIGLSYTACVTGTRRSLAPSVRSLSPAEPSGRSRGARSRCYFRDEPCHRVCTPLSCRLVDPCPSLRRLGHVPNLDLPARGLPVSRPSFVYLLRVMEAGQNHHRHSAASLRRTKIARQASSSHAPRDSQVRNPSSNHDGLWKEKISLRRCRRLYSLPSHV